jgi:hypothetical protein
VTSSLLLLLFGVMVYGQVCVLIIVHCVLFPFSHDGHVLSRIMSQLMSRARTSRYRMVLGMVR